MGNTTYSNTKSSLHIRSSPYHRGQSSVYSMPQSIKFIVSVYDDELEFNDASTLLGH